MHLLQELVRLHRLGTRCREVARLLRISPNTERDYRRALHQAGLLEGEARQLPEVHVLKLAIEKYRPKAWLPAQNVSSIQKWTPQVKKMLERGATPGPIFDLLRLDQEFSGSLSAVKRLCRRLQKQMDPNPSSVVIPVETEPGEVAQVDFGYAGTLYDPLEGKFRKAWFFVMVLGYSRDMFVAVVFDQKVNTWVDLHIRAFRYFGGVPKVIVPDNLKAAVIRAAFGVDDQVSINRTYRELARFYGFKIDPTPPYSPKKKGKVESAVKYVKRSFFKPRGQMTITQARQGLSVWLKEIAGQRVHGTTHQKPREVFEKEERAALIPLPRSDYEVIIWRQAKLHTDCHLQFDRRLYSAPWPLVGQTLWVRATPKSIYIFDDTKRVATHSRTCPTRRSTNKDHLPPQRSDYRFRSRRVWLERARALGTEVEAFAQAVFDADDVLYQLRIVQNVVSHLERYPKERAQKACARALHFGSLQYRTIQNILNKGLDFQPLPQTSTAPKLHNPRFARRATEIVNPNLELFDSSNGGSYEYH